MSKRTAIWTAVKAVLLLAVVGLLYLVLRRIGFRSILEAIRGADRRAIVAAALLQLAVLMLWCLRWLQVMRPESRTGFFATLPIYMAGVFVNTITPGARVGGEPVRAYYMSRAFGGEKTAYLGTIIADKMGYGAVFMGFVIVSVFFVVGFVPIGLAYKVVFGGAVAFILLAVMSGLLLRHHIGQRSRLLGRLLPAIYNGRLLKLLRRRFPTYEHFEQYVIGKMDNLLSPLSRAATSPKALTKIVTISAVSWLAVCLAHKLLFAGLGVEIAFSKVVVIVTISTFLGDISASPGGAGFMEAAMIALCAAFGVQYQAAVAVTLIGRGIFYACGLGVGGTCLAVLAGMYGRTRQETSEAEPTDAVPERPLEKG